MGKIYDNNKYFSKIFWITIIIITQTFIHGLELEANFGLVAASS